MTSSLLPAFLPKDVSFPTPGLAFYVAEGRLGMVHTDMNDRLLATSFVEVRSPGADYTRLAADRIGGATVGA